MKAKNFWKAVGFLALIAVVYLLSSIGAGAVIGIVIAAMNMPAIMEASGDAMAVNEIMMEKIADFALPMVVAGNLITLGIIMLFFLARKDKFMHYVGFKKVKASDLALTMLLGIFLNFIISPVLVSAMEYIPSSMVDKYAEVMEMIVGGSSIIMIIITTSIVAPLFEEIIVRGIIFNDFKKAVPLWLAIIIQALAFGVMHGNIIQGTYAFIIGVVFGLVYYKYKSIWIPIGMHFTFNTISLVTESIMGVEPSMTAYMIQLVIGVLGCASVVWLMKRNYVAEDYREAISTLDEVEPVDETMVENV